MSIKDWTPEQVKNAQLFGICRVCGEPREQKLVDPPPSLLLSLVCPNGHPQG